MSPTPQDIRTFAATLNERRVQTKGPIRLVRTLLRTAHEGGHLDVIPPFPLGLIRTSRKLPDAPSSGDFEKMVAQAEGWMRVAIALSGLAGMRMGEVLALEVRDVDFEGHRILLRRALSEGVSLTPKSGVCAVKAVHTFGAGGVASLLLSRRGSASQSRHTALRPCFALVVQGAKSLTVASASLRVGYQSPSQFTREYARMFGRPPRRDVDADTLAPRSHRPVSEARR